MSCQRSHGSTSSNVSLSANDWRDSSKIIVNTGSVCWFKKCRPEDCVNWTPTEDCLIGDLGDLPNCLVIEHKQSSFCLLYTSPSPRD